MGEPQPQFVIVDEGNLNTVFRCRKCGCRTRFNYHVAQDRRLTYPMLSKPFPDFSSFRRACLEQLEETHRCSTA